MCCRVRLMCCLIVNIEYALFQKTDILLDMFSKQHISFFQLIIFLKKNLLTISKVNKNFNLLHNNTTETVSKTAKSSLPMVTVYRLKSSTPKDV